MPGAAGEIFQAFGAAHNHLVIDSVIGACKSHNERTPRNRPGHAHGTQNRFRAGIAEGCRVKTRQLTNKVTDGSRELVLRTDLVAFVHLLTNGLGQQVRLIAQHIGAKSIQRVNVFIAVNVFYLTAF